VSDPPAFRVVAILACHQRRERTRAALASLFAQDIGRDAALEAVVVDDASTDGTSDVIREEFPRTHLLHGSGDLYWAGGMRLAEDAARSRHYDYMLWLNDDVVLAPDAVRRLLSVARRAGDAAIVVGALRDPGTGETTYSGLRRSRWHPLRWQALEPAHLALEADTFNGNVVLVPRRVCEAVGGIDGRLVHAAGDLDYGLRARKLGFPTLLAPAHVGTCERGEALRTADAPLRQAIRMLFGPKGFPPGPRARYLLRHGGPLWPLYWIAPYAKFVWQRVAKALFAARSREPRS
jgi:GT2 family glycosyltransferase